MKTILLWICAAVMAVSFTNCGNKQTETKLDPELEKQLGTIKTAAEEGAELGRHFQAHRRGEGGLHRQAHQWRGIRLQPRRGSGFSIAERGARVP